MANMPGALAYKVPAGSVEDFVRQTERWFHVAEGTVRRDRGQLKAAIGETIADPLGAASYLWTRAVPARRYRSRVGAFDEKWEVTYTAKRD
jgi:hypothetical protein